MKHVISRWKSYRWILLIVILAIGLRLPLLNGSFWLDEAAQALESSRPFNQQFQIVADFQPPLIHLIVHFAEAVSRSEWWLRLWGALIPAIGSIMASYLIGKKLVSEKVGLIAALLLATSAFHLYFSQELRPYALPTLWATLSWLVILSFSDQSKTRFKWSIWIVMSILGIYSSYLYPFLLLSQIGWIATTRKNFSKLSISVLAIGASFVPWLPTFLAQLQAGQLLRQNLPGWQNVVSTAQFKTPFLVLGKFLFGQLDLSLNLVFLGIVAVIAVLIILAWLTRRSTKQTNGQFFFLLTWILVPALTAWVISFWVPVIQPKRVLFLLPACYLLVGFIFAQTKIKWLEWGGILLFLAINFISVSLYYHDPRLQREDWRSLITQIQNKYPANQTAAVFAFDEAFAPWRWYANPQIKTITTGHVYVNDAAQVETAISPAKNYQYIVTFDYLTDLSDPERLTQKTIESWGYKQNQIYDRPGIGFTRIYSQSQSTIANQL